MHVRWTDEAFSDLEEIASFLQRSSVTAAQRVASEIVASAETLSAFPHRGRLAATPGTRELVLKNVGYILTYEVLGDAVFILAIRHGAQEYPRRS